MSEDEVKQALKGLYWIKEEVKIWDDAAKMYDTPYSQAIRDKFLKLQAETMQRAARVDAWFELVSEPRVREVLQARYLENMKVEKIADNMGYTSQSIYKLHNKGIKQLAAALAELPN